jgi:anaerobic magnesium-protoporphyrin IX monomethyl ester cyclase
MVPVQPMRLLFIRPKSRTFVHAPLGFLHLASALRSRGHEAAILDGMAAEVTPEIAAAKAREWSAGAIGFGGMSCEYPENRVFALRLRALMPGATFVFDGAHASGNPEQCLGDGADFVLVGEGEVTLPRLLDSMPSGCSPSRVWVGAPPDLEREPEPAYDLVDMESYMRASCPWFFPQGRRALPVMTSRGCPYRCSYCHSTHGKQFRGISPLRVVDRIASLVHRYRVDEVMIVDDIFNADLERAKDICRELIRRKLGVRLQFPYGLRGDRCDREVIRLMRLAGTHYFGIAIETAAPERMKKIGKNLDIEACWRTACWAREEGIEVCGFFMIGFPGESLSEARTTADLALAAPLDWVFMSLAAAYGGTRLRDEIGEAQLDVRFPFAASASVSELRRIRRSLYLRFYSRPRHLLRLLRTLSDRENWGKVGSAVLQRLRLNNDIALN